MFIKVRYGDDSILVCNPRCRSINLLSYIKQKIRLNGDDVIDLTDEKGFTINLQSKPHEMVSDSTSGKQVFVVVKRTRDAQEYEPLLNNLHALLPGYKMQTHPKIGKEETVSVQKSTKSSKTKPSSHHKK